jgi:hypothetical protein
MNLTVQNFREAAATTLGNLKLDSANDNAPQIKDAGKIAWIKSALGLSGAQRANATIIDALKNAINNNSAYTRLSEDERNTILKDLQSSRPLTGAKVKATLDKLDNMLQRHQDFNLKFNKAFDDAAGIQGLAKDIIPQDIIFEDPIKNRRYHALVNKMDTAIENAKSKTPENIHKIQSDIINEFVMSNLPADKQKSQPGFQAIRDDDHLLGESNTAKPVKTPNLTVVTITPEVDRLIDDINGPGLQCVMAELLPKFESNKSEDYVGSQLYKDVARNMHLTLDEVHVKKGLEPIKYYDHLAEFVTGGTTNKLENLDAPGRRQVFMLASILHQGVYGSVMFRGAQTLHPDIYNTSSKDMISLLSNEPSQSISMVRNADNGDIKIRIDIANTINYVIKDGGDNCITTDATRSRINATATFTINGASFAKLSEQQWEGERAKHPKDAPLKIQTPLKIQDAKLDIRDMQLDANIALYKAKEAK